MLIQTLRDNVLVPLNLRRFGAVIDPPPPPPVDPGLVRTTSGLIYRTDFADLTGWTNDGSWSVAANDSFVSFGALPYTLLGPGPAGPGGDVEGIREPQIFEEVIDETLTNWYMLYDSGDGTGGWRQHMAASTDRGRTWTKHGPVGAGLDNGAGGTYDAVATGWIEQRSGVFYLHRVTAMDTFPSPNIGLPRGPYGWDTWTAASPLGPWTFVNKTDLVPGSDWADVEYLPGSIFKDEATWHAAVQGTQTSPYYVVGLATGPGATGPWTPAADPFWDHGYFGSRSPENPKMLQHPMLPGKWLLLINMIAASGVVTDRNAVMISSSLTNWSASQIEYSQSKSPLDGGIEAVGVASHMTNAGGQLVYDPDNGNLPVIYDSKALRYSAGWHLGRSALAAVLEYSATEARFSDAVAINKQITRALAHTNFQAEFVLRLSSGVDTNIGMWFRHDNAGNGYRLVARSTQPLLLQKMVGGVVSFLAGPSHLDTTAYKVGNDGSLARIRIEVTGSNIKAWIDGVLQIDHTDATFATGTHIAFSGFAATGAVRKFSMRSGNDITVTGLAPAQTVVLRASGGLPVSEAVANGAGVAVLPCTHGPHFAIEIDTVDRVVSDGQQLWPGDVIEVP